MRWLFPLGRTVRGCCGAAFSVAAFSLAVAFPAAAGDWPQILGPSRNGIAAADEKLADRWPDGGPRTLWKRPVGSGYAGVAVAGERVVLFHRVDGNEVVEAIEATSGKTLWSDGQRTTFQPQVGGGDGPLCVPVIHDGMVITYGAQGRLACHELASGRRLWSRETHRDFDASEGYFGAGSTPLVVGDRVIVNVGGGKQEAGIVGFVLATGETAWTRTTELAGYAAATAAVVAGEPHVLMVTRLSCLLLEPREGTIRWRFPFGQRGPTVNAATPLVLGGDHLLVTASYGIGSVYAAFDATAATPVWDGEQSLATQYCTPIAIAGRIYAIDGRDDVPPADFKCLDEKTGRVLWSERGFGYGTLLAADGKLVIAKTEGELLLAKAGETALEVLARARPLAGTLRPLPALAAGRLYLRDDTTLTCLDLRP